MATVYTPNYNLAKPDRGVTNWDDEINGNFDIIDEVLYELEQHTTATGNPHQTTYQDVGAAPQIHTHSGDDISGPVAEARNADTTDGLHFDRHGNLLRFSSDGVNFIYTGDMIAADYDTNGDKVVNAAEYAFQAGDADTTDGFHASQNAVSSTLAVRDASADLTARTFVSTASHGTPPLTVQSQTVVQNLNADKVDGYDASTSSTANTIAARDSNADLTARVLKSSATTGTAPISITSTTVCTNLNADMVDGKHASELTRIITSDLTLNVPSQYSTIQAALDSIRDAFIPSNVTVTIQVDSGTYTHTSPIVIQHPCGSQIRIIGATPVTTTLTGVGTISGSAGNWSVPLQVESASGIAVGDYVIVKNTSGTDDHYALRGVWEVTGVSGNTVTIKNTHRKSTFPTFTVSGGTVVALKTILKFNGCSGIVAYDSCLGYLNNVAIIGNLSSDTRGIVAGKIFETQAKEGKGAVVCGSNVGVSSFVVGLYALSGTIHAQNVASSGNIDVGFYATYSGSIIAPGSIASGNGSGGFYATSSGSIIASYSTASGNGSGGLATLYSGSIVATYSIASGNGSVGFYAALSGSIAAINSTASGNSTDYKAERMGCIYVYGYQGSPTFSPALNTEGNSNAIITT